MTGKPFHVGGVINVADGEDTKDIQSPKIAKDRLFVVEFVGVNVFYNRSSSFFRLKSIRIPTQVFTQFS